MENSVGKLGGTEKSEIIRKTKSLDIQSLYKSKGGSKEVGHDKGKTGVEERDVVKKKKRKSRKEVALSSFESAGKKSRNSVDEVCVDGVDLGLASSARSVSGSIQKLNGSNGFNGSNDLNGVSLNDNGNFVCIPRRRRGSVGRNKFMRNHVFKASGSSSSIDQIAKVKDEPKEIVHDQVSRKAEPSDSKASYVNQIGKLNSNSGGKSRPKVKQKKGVDGLKGNKKGKELAAVSSSRHAKVEDGHLVVNNGDASSRKSQSNRRKRKNLAAGSETVANKVEPSVDNSKSTRDLFPEDDEENLEQNAARMLSSRFDPSYTVFSSKNRSSALSSAKGLVFFVPPTQNIGSRASVDVTESTSADAADRVLRPRKQHKGKGQSRKRRHFYEIFSRDLDAHWFLNRRIKIFWPLDESWYYGLVNDYDADRKLHHIKYDDRDEEWISLQNERFKLLLLPGEVPDKPKQRESAIDDNHTNTERRGLHTNDETFLGSHMETEPIISWLARSSLRVKSSPSTSLKKQKILQFSSSFFPPSLSDKSVDACKNEDMGLMGRETSHPNYSSALPDRSTDGRKDEKSVLESTSSRKEGHLPVVYVRRRFRKNSEASNILSANNSAHGSLPDAIASLPSVAQSFRSSAKNNVSLECFGPHEIPWSIGSACMLKLNTTFTESKQFRIEVCVSLRPLLNYALGAEIIWLLHNIFLLQFGTMVTIWPPVLLEVLFVDNIVGLRFFLFEGCLKQAVAFVFLVLTVFPEPDNHVECIDLQMPVTSIRFKLSCIQNFRKQQVFAYYSISKLKDSDWLYLDSELQPHCLLTKQLSLPECTYDNVKLLEGGSKDLRMSSAGQNSSFQVVRKKSMLGVMPMNSVSKESCHVNRHQPSSIFGLKHGSLPPFALTFTAAPTFFRSLHLKLLMERSITSISLQDRDSVYSLDHSEYICRSVADDHRHIEDCSANSPESSPESIPKMSCAESACSHFSCTKLQLGTAADDEVSTDGDLMKSSQHAPSGQVNVSGISNCSVDARNIAVDMIVESEKWEGHNLQSEEFVPVLSPQNPKDHTLLINGKANFNLKGMSVEIPQFDEVDRDIYRKTHSAQQVSDLAWNLGDGIICSPNPTGPRSLWHRNRSGLSSFSFGDLSHVWPDGKTDVIRNGFGNGPKRPRTQVQYTLPSGGLDLSSKNKSHSQNGLPFKRIRRANEKRILDGSKGSRKNLEFVACDANLLITGGDRGWRECGARVFLVGADQNEWKLAVKHSGDTKYSYKVSQDLQPGSTNRFTHAMMWKGGKDWALEFPDRSQWFLFKEMHEECHNRNIRAASIKNIPIPGVCLIEEFDDDAAEMPFVCSPKYFRQVETDVEMAMDTSHVLYDMDSDDEEWIVRSRLSLTTQESKHDTISDELFEKTMDMLEKISYAQQRDQFTVDEIEELIVGDGPMEVTKVIYEHWREKRQRKGLALIRHLQPPLWERYQQQLKEWEQLMTKPTTVPSSGGQEKAHSVEKPPMFAFCFKPRGLEVLNKGSKHRPHRKYSVSVNNHAVFGDLDGPHSSGRRINGFPFGDERAIYPSNSHDSSDISPLHASTRIYSPRDTGPGYFSLNGDASEWNHHPKLHRNNSKKIGTFASASNPRNRNTGKRNGVQLWNMPLPDYWPGEKYHLAVPPYRYQSEQFGGSDLDEFKLRDASGAAKHARNMAKLKRERAQKLLYMADLAIHKAVVALMTAEAIKASHEDSNSDG